MHRQSPVSINIPFDIKTLSSMPPALYKLKTRVPFPAEMLFKFASLVMNADAYDPKLKNNEESPSVKT